MNSDDFENRLQAQPLRSLPPGWRDDILRQAASARVIETETDRNDNPDSATGSTRSPAIRGGWREWLWPSPAAWAGLAAVWMVIAALHAISDLPFAQMARPVAGPASEVVTTVAAQQRELVRLLDNSL